MRPTRPAAEAEAEADILAMAAAALAALASESAFRDGLVDDDVDGGGRGGLQHYSDCARQLLRVFVRGWRLSRAGGVAAAWQACKARARARSASSTAADARVLRDATRALAALVAPPASMAAMAGGGTGVKYSRAQRTRARRIVPRRVALRGTHAQPGRHRGLERCQRRGSATARPPGAAAARDDRRPLAPGRGGGAVHYLAWPCPRHSRQVHHAVASGGGGGAAVAAAAAQALHALCADAGARAMVDARPQSTPRDAEAAATQSQSQSQPRVPPSHGAVAGARARHHRYLRGPRTRRRSVERFRSALERRGIGRGGAGRGAAVGAAQARRAGGRAGCSARWLRLCRLLVEAAPLAPFFELIRHGTTPRSWRRRRWRWPP